MIVLSLTNNNEASASICDTKKKLSLRFQRKDLTEKKIFLACRLTQSIFY